MEKKVDILLATYKPNIAYLEKQIESILNQTYKNINLIISDDCSNDEVTINTLQKYAKNDDRIIIYEQKQNLGYIKNFEFLLEKSTAKYVAFCDQDDIWDTDKIKKSLKKLIELNVDLVYCNARHIDENDKIIHEDYFKYKNMPLVKGKDKTLGMSRYLGIGCSQIFTSEVKEKMIPFKNCVMAHDWLASFIANEGKGVDYIEEPLFSYRLHTNNVFGGRSLAQNISSWKNKNGKSFNSYLKYRNEKVIDKAYLDGAKMCLEYSEQENNKKILEELINYYNNIKKTKYINLHFSKYIKYLNGKNIGKKKIKELIIFHMPIFGYIIFSLQK